MSITLDQCMALIRDSYALKKDSETQAFWLETASKLSEEDRQKLVDVLVKEAEDVANIQADHKQREIKINQQQIDFLDEVIHKKLPALSRKAEEKTRKSENPDALLEQLNNEQ